MEIIYTAETYATACNLFISTKKVLDKALRSVSANYYGNEFESISIIPIIMPESMHENYKERKLIRGKLFEADVRLYVDYQRFIRGRFDIEAEPYKQERLLLLLKNIVDSIMVLESWKKGDFQGEKLIEDILKAMNMKREDLEKL